MAPAAARPPRPTTLLVAAVADSGRAGAGRDGAVRPTARSALADRPGGTSRLRLGYSGHRGGRLSLGNCRGQPPGRPGCQLHGRLPGIRPTGHRRRPVLRRLVRLHQRALQCFRLGLHLLGVLLLMLPGLITTLLMREPTVPLQTQQEAARFSFNHQMLSILVLIVLMVSVPATFTQLYSSDILLVLQGRMGVVELIGEDRAFLRFLLYLILSTLCLSAMGRRSLAPVLTPISDFIQRYRWQALLLLGLIATYRLSDTVLGVMANVFYIDQGFSKEQIAGVSKLFGLIMTLLGAGFGGLLIVRFGILPILFIGGAASAATNLLFLMLTSMGANLEMLVLTISCDNFSSGLATSAFVAYLSSLTSLKFSATQYALLSSIMLLLPRLIGGYSGVLVEKHGYAQFFLFTALLGVPTLLLILWQSRQQPLSPEPTEDGDTVTERS
ncbi:hypothetical protein ACFSVK_10965 [Azorhizophilus paspali]|uniref:hypothetical protein n=1 Tax=Azorhizophilus paspali TaxID=69963 RepID=UPI003625FC2B